MKKLLTLAVTALLVCAFAFTSYAETVTKISGQVRSRSEGSRRNFSSTFDHLQTYTFLRSRVNIHATVDDNAVGFVQFQDSRILGNPGQSGTNLSSTENVDLHQAYIKYNLFTKENWSIGFKGGRFEYNWANQRLFGAVGWHNVGRSWEGGLAWYDNKSITVTAGSFKVAEVNDPIDDLDANIGILSLDLKKTNLQFLIAVESEAQGDIMNRATIAVYYKNKHEQFDFEVTGAIQGGEFLETIDYGGYMFAGEVGHSFEGEKNARLALGIDFASGDDGTPGEINTFILPYWTGHKFNGYMDYFLGGGPNGLVDIMVRGKFDFTKGWTVGGDLHLFSAAEEYSGATEMTKDVGTEIDLFVKTNRVKGVSLQWGASFFNAKDEFADVADKQSGLWLYEQTTINF